MHGLAYSIFTCIQHKKSKGKKMQFQAWGYYFCVVRELEVNFEKGSLRFQIKMVLAHQGGKLTKKGLKISKLESERSRIHYICPWSTVYSITQVMHAMINPVWPWLSQTKWIARSSEGELNGRKQHIFTVFVWKVVHNNDKIYSKSISR